MLAFLTRRKLIDILFFSSVLGLLYYYSSRLSFPTFHQSNIHPLSDPPSSSELEALHVAPPRKHHTHILHPDPPAGFAAFSRLYFLKGTLFAVAPDQRSKSSYPDLKHFISNPGLRGTTQNNEPTSEEMQLLTEEEALHILGPLEDAVSIPGFTLILYDSNQYLGHYYHWWGEIILGAMRSYSSLSLQPDMESPLMEPARFIIANVDDKSWRDPAGIDGPLMRAAFPGVSIESAGFWKDIKALQRPFVFERAMVVDRRAAHRHPLSWKLGKMISSTMNITAPKHFWEPIRQRLLRNLGRVLSEPIAVQENGAGQPSVPVVVYISRQKSRRSLSDAAHAGLVHALQKLEKEGICRVYVSKMESLSFQEQVELVSKATIMIGVHGNGLTHQLWMPPSPRSTVIEIFFPETYLQDYSMLSRNMGHKHYAIWNNRTLTFDEGEWFDGVKGGNPDDFHGKNIPVDGEIVANVVKERLAIPLI